MQTEISQALARDFAARHILGACNWVLDAVQAVQCSDAPEWVPFDQSEVDLAWDAMRVARASLDRAPAGALPADPLRIARERMATADLATDYEGTPDEARELAAEVRELADALHDERDDHDSEDSWWDSFDAARSALNEYADALESAADEPEEPEIYQAFMVSDWLGWFLRDRYAGEGVIRDDNGNFIWLRQCCGQACHMDSCIMAAAREWFGDPAGGDQSRAWTRYSRALEGNAGRRLLDAAAALLRDPYLADPINNDRMGPLRDAVAEVERVARGDE